MKKLCKNCQYWRNPAAMPGLNFTGHWCSNSNSLHSLTETFADFSCHEFYRRGEKGTFENPYGTIAEAISAVRGTGETIFVYAPPNDAMKIFTHFSDYIKQKDDAKEGKGDR